MCWWNPYKHQIYGSSVIKKNTEGKYYYYSFKIFPRFWLVKTTRIIHHNQLLLQRILSYSTDDIKSAARCRLLNHWRPRLLNRWPRKPEDKVMFFDKGCEQVYKFERRKCFEWVVKQLLNLAFVGYEKFCRPSASVDKTHLDLQNSSCILLSLFSNC